MVAGDRSPAAFFAESLIGTGGQIVFPENYLASVYTKVRAAGGVCVADEVQVGFGRTGDHVWCFQSQGVTPDIVTMGKPIANGHPMAAVVTRREIAEAFDNGITYFNTFGGNPVSCAIGLACLDVLEQEELMTNTQAMSKALMTGLAELRAAHELIGDVRGLGLYIGVELVTDRQARLPATQAAKKIVESMKTQGVLVNTNGYDSNVLKIKPPMIIDHADVSHLLEAFESALSEVAVCR
jgi:4-aminobutyrate aminotransferase-like enzyme